jgi:hypothetical protein
MGFESFDRDFRRAERSIERKATFMMAFAVIWIAFLMGVLGTALFLLGRWTGVW